MTHPGNALQKGIFDALCANGPLTTALGGHFIYDFIPQGSPSPYVQIGDDTNANWDTKTTNGWDMTLTIHAFAFEQAGRKLIKSIIGLIYDALHHQAITVSGFNLIMLNHEFDHCFLEPQIESATDKYWHGVIRFRAVVTN